jgi:hypothetical protein
MFRGRLAPDEATGGPRVYQKQDGTWAAQYEFVVERMTLLNNGGRGATPTEAVADAAPAPDFNADFA